MLCLPNCDCVRVLTVLEFTVFGMIKCSLFGGESRLRLTKLEPIWMDMSNNNDLYADAEHFGVKQTKTDLSAMGIPPDDTPE